MEVRRHLQHRTTCDGDRGVSDVKQMCKFCRDTSARKACIGQRPSSSKPTSFGIWLVRSTSTRGHPTLSSTFGLGSLPRHAYQALWRSWYKLDSRLYIRWLAPAGPWPSKIDAC